MAFAAPVLVERCDIPLKSQVVVESDALVHTSTIEGATTKHNIIGGDAGVDENPNEIRKHLMEHLQSLPPDEVLKLQGILNLLVSEMTETQITEHDVLFCGSNGTTIIKALHFPREVLGTDGPVLLPSATEHVLLAAYSNEFIQHNVDATRNVFTDPSVCEAQWEMFLNGLAEEIAEKHEQEYRDEFDEILAF